VEALDFPVVDGLHLAPELADVLLGVITGKNFAEAFEGQQFGREFVAAENGLEFRRGAGDDAEPDGNERAFRRLCRAIRAGGRNWRTASTAGPCCLRRRSRICARKADQLSVADVALEPEA